MRKAFLAVALMGLLSISLSAQDVYRGYMKTAAANFGQLRMATDNAAAKGPASALAEVFDKVANYWKDKGATDAVGFAETIRDAARAIETGSGDLDANKAKIQSSCGGCHMAHRDGQAPNFTIK